MEFYIIRFYGEVTTIQETYNKDRFDSILVVVDQLIK